MTYFKTFNTINYDFTVPSDTTPIIENITDTARRTYLNITQENLDNLCDTYIVQSGMRPEHIAEKLYNNPRLHWTILFVNKISDVNAEWPIDENSLVDFVEKKYGAGNANNVHHYEKMPEGIVMDPAFVLATYGENALLVTNYEHEYNLNEGKRIIKVIKPQNIPSFVTMFESV